MINRFHAHAGTTRAWVGNPSQSPGFSKETPNETKSDLKRRYGEKITNAETQPQDRVGGCRTI